MKVLVTGGSGFLGGRVIELLLEDGREVRAYSRRPLPGLEAKGAQVVLGGFGDADRLAAAMEGAGAVVHCAGRTGVWGPLEPFLESNTRGAERMLEAARRSDPKIFIYTSSPSVAADKGGLEGADEDAPYVTSRRHGYPYSKMLAEKAVLAAGSPGFRTLALRPHLIWGPGDPHFLPRIFRLEARGRLRIVSGGPYLASHTFIDNAANAHLLALRALESGTAASGKSFFIAEPKPMDVWELINRILACGGRPPVTKTAPRFLLKAYGAVCELLWRALPLKGEPPMTSFTAGHLSSSHWFDIGRAERLLGYRPKVRLEDAFRLLAESLGGQPPKEA
jgi:nucleoside-diphosphate-sugar epimerase